ncbi:hypothetical protein B0T10DRAFT_479103 [Thelonectria olida]|uniref:Chromo domain-containing protein n=1 Tax=Thelonectria olida TaxID=1576542 RepID=A0A9P8WB03_9HYPO|nr:hypothetical protein B0T10DRAFT_479103 [Thelonectria olida]
MDSSTTVIVTADRSLKRKRESPKRTKIVIELPSKPRDYVPGSGPPLRRISLLPAQDSTAYILERILLPPAGVAADGKPLPKRMTYIVGWHDLPAARMLVPVMKVLDYVSPRALEEWEYNMELELDEERAKMEEEKAEEKVQPKPKKKRGRPPIHSQIEAAVVAEPDNEALKTGRPTTGAMSLTTPTKKRLRDFDDLSDEEGSPSRQLKQESMRSSMDIDMREDSMDLVHSGNDLVLEEDVASKQSADSYGPSGTRGLRKDDIPSSITSDVQSSKPAAPLRTAPKPPLIATAAAPRKETPVPLPKLPGFPGSQPVGPQWSVQRTSSFTSAGGSATFTSSNPNTPTLSTEPSFATPTAKPKRTPKTKDSSKKPKKGRTKSTKPAKPPPQESQQPSRADDEADTGEPAWEVKRVEAVELYEVEGVGRVRYFKVLWEGDWPPEQNPSWEPEANLPPSLVRNFLKRGKKKATPKTTPKAKKPLEQQSILPWATVGVKYKSVSEAFAGGEDAGLIGAQEDALRDTRDDDEYGEQEEFLVVEDEPPAKKARKQGSVGWNRNGNGSSAGFGAWGNVGI